MVIGTTTEAKALSGEAPRVRAVGARLSGELSAIQGQYASSTQDASVSNKVEGELVAAYQKLSAEMQRLLKQVKHKRTPDIW